MFPRCEWQKRSPAHREAFEKTTDVWEAIPRTAGARRFMLEKELREADSRIREDYEILLRQLSY